MANTAKDETELRVMVAAMRAKVTSLEFHLFDPSDTVEYATALVLTSNRILDCALDISKHAAKIESAISQDRSRILRER